MSGAASLLAAAVMTAATSAPPSAAAPGAIRRAGPSGSVLIFEEDRSVPIVHVVVASRSGSAADPRHREGLTNLAAEWARHGAGGRTRAELDEALDALGATLDVRTEPDSTRLEGEVLARNLDAYLALVGDILIRPTFSPAEFARTRQEVLGQIDEQRNDDRLLCARFFMRNLFGEHPYGHPSEGIKPALEAATPAEVAAHFRRHFVGHNLVFAFSGDVEADALSAALAKAMRGLSDAAAPPVNPLEMRAPVALAGWRIQLVDKPERQQSQLMFGHPAVRASDPDFVPLSVGLAAFGGHAMSSTLMDEVRRKRGLAYGAYFSLEERRATGGAVGWVFSGTDKTVPMVKLVLKLYVSFMEKGLDAQQFAFFQRFLAGSHAAELDAPDRRLDARVTHEIAGLPPDFLETFAARVGAATLDAVNAAIKRHVHARDLAITMVATAASMKKLLIEAKVQESAIDIVPYDSY
ncbi:MAG TPA: pitrilysin family protein [Polyangia bacterium]|nr:pitrilysin family protein [Polyangia bacterium]